MDNVISVIVPVYNVEEYLGECILSLVKQTYRNIEIILIDDGSTDASPKICDEWGRRDSRIKVLHTDNCGVSHARNVGLEVMSGDYIGFVDADDWLESDTYELLLREIISKNADVVGGGYTREELIGGIVTLRKGQSKVFSREEILQEIFSCKAPKLLYWELCDKLLKKEIVTSIRFDEKIALAEDKLFFWQVMQKVSTFAYVPLFKYHYRMREGSAIHKGISSKSVSCLRAERKIWDLAQSENKKIRQVILSNYVNTVLGITRQMMLLDSKGYYNYIRENQEEVRCNLLRWIMLPDLSFRSRLGMIFFSLPHRICFSLRKIIKKRSD